MRYSKWLAGGALVVLSALAPVACQAATTPTTVASVGTTATQDTAVSQNISTTLGRSGPEVALIYNGKVAAEGGPEALATVARSLGMEVEYFASAGQLPALLEDASFCMIGGTEDDLTPLLKEFTPAVSQVLEDWLRAGGGYLGICGGGYIASSGWEDVDGFVEALGIAPMDTEAWVEQEDPRIITVDWNGAERPIYYQYGPVFLVDKESGVKVLARYDDGRVAALAVDLGKGRVVVCGPHPEADETWLDDDPAPVRADTWEPTEDLAAALLGELKE
jgi:hypothetical protein